MPLTERPHGDRTPSEATYNRGCRCDLCREARRLAYHARKATRAERKARGEPILTRTGKRGASVAKKDNKAKILGLVAHGMKPHEAIRSLGVTVSTYERWRLEDKAWSEQVTGLRRQNRDGRVPGLGFVDFRQTMFGRPTAGHHFRMIEAIERAEPDTITMILAFPEAAKTSVFTDRINYVLGAVNPDFRFCVISEGQDLARKIVAHVASRMTDEVQYGAYMAAHGPFKSPDRTLGKAWNADYLQVLQAKNDEKEPSLEARGWGSKLYGGRYDEIILDDMQSSESLNQTPQMLRYLRQTVLTRPAAGVGKTFYIGSRVGIGDLPETLLDEGMIDQQVIIPALTNWLPRDEHFYVDKEHKVHLVPECPDISTWPEHWPMLRLAQRRKLVGEEIWARTYMCRQVAEAGASFTEPMLEGVKSRDRGLGPSVQGTGRIMSIDPALDTGIAAFGMYAYSSSNLSMLDVLERSDCQRYEDIYEQVGMWAMRYRPNWVVLERNNFQAGMEYDDRLLELARKFGFEVIPHHTNRNKNDPVIGVKMMASAFIDKELSLPWGDDEATTKVGVLIDELRNWRPKQKMKQNLVMQLWFAWLLWEQLREEIGLILPDQFAPSWAKAGSHVPSWARSA